MVIFDIWTNKITINIYSDSGGLIIITRLNVALANVMVRGDCSNFCQLLVLRLLCFKRLLELDR